MSVTTVMAAQCAVNGDTEGEWHLVTQGSLLVVTSGQPPGTLHHLCTILVLGVVRGITDIDTKVTFLSGLNTLIDINRAFCEIFSVIIPVSLIDWIMPGPSETNWGAGALRLLLNYYNPALFVFQSWKSLDNIEQTKVIVPGRPGPGSWELASDLLRCDPWAHPLLHSSHCSHHLIPDLE